MYTLYSSKQKESKTEIVNSGNCIGIFIPSANDNTIFVQVRNFVTAKYATVLYNFENVNHIVREISCNVHKNYVYSR